ncbi:MAG: hypothetical protein ABIS10_12325 [Novosphingobium sp.]
MNNAALEEQVLHVPQAQRVPDVHHHHAPDHLGRRVETAERIVDFWLLIQAG